MTPFGGPSNVQAHIDMQIVIVVIVIVVAKIVVLQVSANTTTITALLTVSISVVQPHTSSSRGIDQRSTMARQLRIDALLQLVVRYSIAQPNERAPRVHAITVLSAIEPLPHHNGLQVRQSRSNLEDLGQLALILDHHNGSIAVVEDVVAGIGSVGGIDAGRNGTGEDGTDIGYQPFGCVASEDANSLEALQSNRDARLGKLCCLVVVLLPCTRSPNSILFILDTTKQRASERARGEISSTAHDATQWMIEIRTINAGCSGKRDTTCWKAVMMVIGVTAPKPLCDSLIGTSRDTSVTQCTPLPLPPATCNKPLSDMEQCGLCPSDELPAVAAALQEEAISPQAQAQQQQQQQQQVGEGWKSSTHA
jgi:hypothetical protein